MLHWLCGFWFSLISKVFCCRIQYWVQISPTPKKKLIWHLGLMLKSNHHRTHAIGFIEHVFWPFGCQELEFDCLKAVLYLFNDLVDVNFKYISLCGDLTWSLLYFSTLLLMIISFLLFLALGWVVLILR